MEFQLLRTMDQVLQLDLGLYFHSAMLVTTSWVSVGGLSELLLVTPVSMFACATSARLSSSPNSRLQILSTHDRVSPVLCSLGVIDFNLNPYFVCQCWHHPVQGRLNSVYVKHTHKSSRDSLGMAVLMAYVAWIQCPC
jgi:hypothetical protein